jgi:hypothetical protein
MWEKSDFPELLTTTRIDSLRALSFLLSFASESRFQYVNLIVRHDRFLSSFCCDSCDCVTLLNIFADSHALYRALTTMHVYWCRVDCVPYAAFSVKYLLYWSLWSKVIGLCFGARRNHMTDF